MIKVTVSDTAFAKELIKSLNDKDYDMKIVVKEKHHTIMYFSGMVFAITNLILLLLISST